MAEIEDRDYFVYGGNVFNRSDYKMLLEMLQMSQEHIKKKLEWPAKIDPFWMDQLKSGWKQWCIQLNRQREAVRKDPANKLSLFYNGSTPYAYYFSGDTIIVWCLAKNEEHAITHANKVCTQQYLHKGWLEAMNGTPKFGNHNW